MTANARGDVVIVGGGIVGMVTAYYLAKAGVPSVVIERDAIGSHASGFAYGGLSPVTGFGIPGPLAEVAQDGMRLHRELAESMRRGNGHRASTSACAPRSPWPSPRRTRRGSRARCPGSNGSRAMRRAGWTLRRPDAWSRASRTRLSGRSCSRAPLTSSRIVLVLALTRAAERLGVTVRHGRLIGLRREAGRVTGVILERDEVACSTVVLALGPWSAETSAWIDVPIEVHPLKGQILRLQAPGPPVACSVGWGHNYATTKGDGLLWAGTTEEEAGFDEESTPEARDEIGAALVKMLPAMADAQVVHQTACLRPLASDGLLVLGRVPRLEHAYMATGAGRKGILFGPAMGRAIADLILTGGAKIALEAFAPGRFVR